MKIEVQPNAEAAAKAGAKFIATLARDTIAAREQFVMAVSGGQVPWRMFRLLADEQVQWHAVHLVQVDERVAPAGDADRNLTHLHASLLAHTSLPPHHIHAMPVEDKNLEAAAQNYSRLLQQIAGSPPVLDLVHLGMGPDGHTASLVPGDPILNVTDRDVALTGMYQKHQRMTLTYPILNRARQILWLVSGAEKASAFQRLVNADPSIPAGRIRQDNAMVLVDLAAAGSSARVEAK
jgi:6-phosphogluconolactonase